MTACIKSIDSSKTSFSYFISWIFFLTGTAYINKHNFKGARVRRKALTVTSMHERWMYIYSTFSFVDHSKCFYTTGYVHTLIQLSLYNIAGYTHTLMDASVGSVRLSVRKLWHAIWGSWESNHWSFFLAEKCSSSRVTAGWIKSNLWMPWWNYQSA